jgi:hypothetical protein
VGWEDMDWIHLAEDRNNWQGFIKAVIKIRFPLKKGKILGYFLRK